VNSFITALSSAARCDQLNGGQIGFVVISFAGEFAGRLMVKQPACFTIEFPCCLNVSWFQVKLLELLCRRAERAERADRRSRIYRKEIDSGTGHFAVRIGLGFHPALHSGPTPPGVAARWRNLGLAPNLGLVFGH